MVEQYQYGKIIKPSTSRVESLLGTDMPLIEFAKHELVEQPASQPEPYIEGNPFAHLEGREAFCLMENHFKFVFEHCARSLTDIDPTNLHLPVTCLVPTGELTGVLSTYS